MSAEPTQSDSAALPIEEAIRGLRAEDFDILMLFSEMHVGQHPFAAFSRESDEAFTCASFIMTHTTSRALPSYLVA